MRFCAFLAFAIAMIAAPVQAGFFYRVSDVNLVSDGVNPTLGSANVFLFSDNPGVDFGTVPNIDSFTVSLRADSFTGSIGSVDFTTISAPTSPFTPLFTQPVLTSWNGVALGFERVTVGSNFTENNRPSFNNAGLFSVNFTVPTNQTGTFRILPTNDAGGFFSDLDPTGAAPAFTPGLTGGTVTITAVPEPSSMALLGISGVALAIRSWRRRKTRV